MPRFSISDVSITTRPSIASAAETESRSTFGTLPSLPPRFLEQETEISVVPFSGYDSFTASKKLSTSRPHFIASYSPKLDLEKGFSNTTMLLAEVQYLLDNDTLSTATQLISSSLPAADQNYITSENIQTFSEAYSVISSLRGVYSAKRQLCRSLAGLDVSTISTNSLNYRTSIARQIGIAGIFAGDVCRVPFFAKNNLNDYFTSFPTSLSRFSEKTFASRIFNLALMSKDLCFFPQSTVSSFFEAADSSLDSLASALYSRSADYPPDASSNADYVLTPTEDSLERCILGLARQRLGVLQDPRPSTVLTVYDADSSDVFESNYRSLLDSLFFDNAALGVRVEAFSRSSFLNTSQNGYSSFEDAIILPCFSKDQKDSVGFSQAASNVAAAQSQIEGIARALNGACSGFGVLDSDFKLSKFIIKCLTVVGDVFTSFGYDRFDPETGVTEETENAVEINAILDLVLIIQRSNALTDLFSQMLDDDAKRLEIVYPSGDPNVDTTYNFVLGDEEDNSVAGRYIIIRDSANDTAWFRSLLHGSEILHPIFNKIDRAIAEFFGEDVTTDQKKVLRSIAYQEIARALKSVYVEIRRFSNPDAADSVNISLYRTDLAAIPRAINFIVTGTSSPDEGDLTLSQPQKTRIFTSLQKITQNALSPLRAITDQAMICKEISDIGASMKAAIAGSDVLSSALSATSAALSNIIRIKGVTPVLGLTRENLSLMSLEYFKRGLPSGFSYYSSKEVLNEQDLKLSASTLLRDRTLSSSDDDLSYFFVGFPFGFLERCRASTTVDADTFDVKFRFLIDTGGVSISREVVKTFCPIMRKSAIFTGQAQEPIDQIRPDLVKCISYIDGISDLTRSRSGDIIFSVEDTSQSLSAQAALIDGTVADFVWTLSGIDFGESFSLDSATYAEPSRMSTIRSDQEKSFARRISPFDNATQARLGSAFQRSRLFGQRRSVDDVFGFKYFDCIYAFPIRSSEIPGFSSTQAIGRVFISVEPSATVTRGNF